MGEQNEKLLNALRNAAKEVERLRGEKQSLVERLTESIAIVGMGCRFPGGVTGPESFWQLLDRGIDGISEVPGTRWDIDALYDPDPDAIGKMMTRSGGFLGDIDRFDPAFFGISPREAMSMDPQQRLLLETSWEAIERAGILPERLMGSDTGVFVGLMYHEYAALGGGLEALDGYFSTGTAGSVASGRISYTLGFKGPSLTVDTACSSSLVTVHLACQSLRQGECSLALAGGVALMLSPSSFVEFSRLRGLAPDGRCKSFSAAADGVGWGEGCGMMVLKRLRDAERDGDPILAIIRGSAVNQDGRSNGLTAPNGPSQQAVIRRALAQAGLSPSEIDYVECHGTGTSLGDPIEVQALGAVMAPDRQPERPLLIGSVKSNIGHTQAAAGAAGIMKVVLALQHDRIPKNLHFGEPNPHISWAELPVRVASEPVEWPSTATPRRAGVSSFGISGTNAHAVLEEAPAPKVTTAAPERPAELVVLSAKSAAALDAQAARLRDHLESHPEQGLGDIAFSLATTRSAMDHRLAVVATSREALRAALGAAGQGETPAGAARGTTTSSRDKLAFLFTGQGAQVLGMGRGSCAAWPAFREAFDRCAALFDQELDRPLREVMSAEPGSAAAALLDQTAFTQPSLFTLEYALAALWRSWGVEPDFVAGHSIGELVAACVAGVFSLEDAVRLTAARGRLMQALPAGGAMVSIAAPEALVAAAVAAHAASVSIAAINGPEQVVIAGAEEPVRAITAAFAARGARTKPLRVSHAFHSPLMQPMLGAFRRVAEAVTYHRPSIALVSNVSGKVVTEELTAPGYWVNHVREAVRFADGIKALHEAGVGAFVEVGPKPTLLGLVPACLPGMEPHMIASLRAGREEAESVLEALGELWEIGGPVDWSALFPGGGRRVPLPTYSWQRERFWPDGHSAADPLAPHAPEGSSTTGQVAAPEAAVPATRRWRGQSAAEARAGLEVLVRETVARVLGFADAGALDTRRGFVEQGLDSLGAVQIRNRLQAELGVPLSATLALDHPTVERLGAHLVADVLELEERTAAHGTGSAAVDEPIAIVGAACRFPGGAEDLDAYWRLLASGTVATTEVPASRWSAAEWYDPDPEAPNRTYVTKGGFLREVETFDPDFFRISPREAVSLDPQQRLLLEVSWEALENAGQVPAALHESRTGVFVGTTYNEYNERLVGLSDEARGPYALTGNMLSIAAGRLSFFLGLHGPTLAVDTACSSSLVAVHLGCQSLRQGECDRALVGGVNLLLSPSGFVMLSRMRALAPDGRCKTFSAAADGYGRAEGCGVVVLKRLRDATRDGDRILGVIRGTAINHDGASSGLTVPSGPAQQAVIREALAQAGVAPADVDFVECHGTGTALGDPIEVQALGVVYGQGRAPERPLVLGSAKAVFGHMEPVAGLVGLLKVLISLGHEQIPAQPELGELNPLLPWDALPVSVAREAVPWPRGTRPRRAGVSSFGLSGTNAHVVLEEAPAADPPPAAPERAAELFVLSGRSAAALDAQAVRLRDHVEAHPEQRLGDIAFSLATTRSSMEHRLAVTAASHEGLLAALGAATPGQTPPGVVRGTTASSRGRLAFLFTGQGAQVLGMGRGLCAAWPGFREAFERCTALFDRELDRPLREVVWGAPGTADAAQLDQTAFTQPALFTLEYALAALWRAWGVEPELVAGHSIGELVAACVAGVFSLEDAVRLVAARGRLMQALPAGGAMVSIAAPEADVAAVVTRHEGSASIAAINGPEQVVIAGANEAVQAIAAAFAARGVRVKPLRVSHAFHSPLMQPMLEAFGRVAEAITYHRPSIPLVSNVSGELVTDEVTAPGYWVRHVREAVRFADGVKALREAGAGTFVEVGPKATLLGLVPACLPDAQPALVASLRAGRDEAASALDALGGFWCMGGSVTWSGLFPTGGRRVSLPSYPWQRQRHWIEVPKQQTSTDASTDADGALWSAVARGSEAVTALLGLPEALHGSVDALLPHIAAWGQRRDEEHAFARRLYDESWPLAAPPPPVAGSHERTWLLVLPSPEECPSAGALATAIERALAEVGSRSERVETASIAHAFTARLLAGARGVITLTALDETIAPEYPHTPRGLAHTLELAKRMPAASRPTPLWIVTRGAVAVRPDEPLPAPLQALHAGLGRVFALEHAEHWGGLVDLPLGVDSVIARLLVASLGDVEDEIALRAEGRHVRRLVRVTPSLPREPWQPTGTVLITGGTGALGAHLARRLAERGTPHVVLTSRRGSDAPGARTLADELEARGTRVSLLACDTSDAAELDQLFARLDDAPEAETLSAVFHTAGLLDDAIIANLAPAQLDRVLQPKVAAAWAIHQRLASRRSAAPLVLFSSISGFLGGMGQANYAAANAYLDALAQHRRALGLPAVSIQWGPWADGGMVTAEIDARARRLGLLALNPAGALRSLELAITERRSLAVMDVDWTRFASSFAADRVRPLLLGVDEARAALEDRAQPDSRTGGAEIPLRAILADLPDVDRLQQLRSLVAAQTARVLGITGASSVDVERGFSDLGLDSLMAVELRRVLQTQTALTLPTTLAFDHPSIDAVSRYLLEQLKAAGGLDRRHPIARPDWPELSALVERLLHAPLDELKATGVFDQMNALTHPVKRLDPTSPSGDASLDELARYVMEND